LFGQVKMGGRMGEGVFAIVMSIMAYIAHAFFLLSLGMYLSTRLKTTSTAVAATLGSYFGVVFFCCCALGPLSVALFGAAGPGSSMVSLFMTNVLHVTVFGAAGFCLMTAAKNRLRRDVFGSG
jgi:ABC-type transport system involved in multi-copper enzyme maturation permease subunit